MSSGPQYDKAYEALKSAHDACFSHPDRNCTGMSHGAFSGVNEALGIVSDLETENAQLKRLLKAHG